MSLIVTGDLLELTKIGLNEVFMNELNAPGSLYESIFDVEDSDKSIEEYAVMAGFGNVQPWNADGGKISYDKPLMGGRILFTHTDYSLAWVISHKMLREDLYGKTSKDLVQSAALSVKHSTEMDAANLFNTGFTATLPQLGGVALFGSQKMLNGTTQSNVLTAAALSEEALSTAISVIKRSKNHRGQPVVYDINTLLVPPELALIAEQLTGSSSAAQLAPTSATTPGTITGSSGVYPNVVGRKFKEVLEWSYLTDTNAWFIGAAKNQRKLKFFWRERPWYDADKDFDTKGVANSVAYAYSCGAITAEGWWGNSGG